MDPLQVVDRHKMPTDALRDILAGRPSFLVGGGPSANELPLDLLHQRGVFSLGVNNVSAHIRTNAFVCSDPPSKFHDGIWLDPTCMKLIPIPKLCTSGRGHLRTKRDGVFEFLQLPEQRRIFTTADCPNVWGFERRSWWAYDDTFFTDRAAAWGNGNAGVIRTKNQKVFCTFLLAIRLLYYLGSRRIFLVGCDFRMTEDGGYSFAQGRTQSAAGNNNAQYAVVNDGLCKMVGNGVFKKAGLEIFNCYQLSGLRAFPYADFAAAIENTLEGYPKVPFDLEGWYEKGDKK